MNDGDFIELSFEMRAGQDKKLISTSKEDLAKKEDIFDDKKKYKNAVIVIGTEGLFKEINDSFKQAEIGKEYEVTVPAKDAYGMRDNKNIKVVPMREFQRNKINPEIGKEVNINNKVGKIISVTPGRVLIDYNHELAGKDLYYKYQVVKVIDDVKEKVNAIIDMDYTDSEEFTVDINNDLISILIPENAKFDVNWIDSKFKIANDIRKYIPDKDVEIKELYKREEKKEEAAEEQKTEQTTEESTDKPKDDVKESQ
ncbi:peptidylprolyl isomerase [Ferroplasma sp.]|uniref:FKBP-type peptidyl-prolyl cis-trans isomerase n=1 Tax=Ferroplasma sp. TaxID=2591003 RepID=UPI0026201B0F|nr:peptidylprolyl isomerase [Ferroplasma sp.]MCL4453780.1 peptidylprolyl isomerase [Candidatus Thermoplasmatota archaeon]